ncbi:keratin, ultra high-sulfur matrix protein-like [Cuculus canorus]|uniref:keratin, ultra high-sulfur matrix protein-like n=1 Tax=Cuculus canorus TaxID=55661 RepID=UPI0023AAD941|nr:keratin, ultra high-sulfur matrix protein-like [Cuculus canorus]
MIYSSGRESYFNLNSTWYDPSGSWLDTRRTPFRYGYNTCCTGCDSEGVEGMRGHDYRCYGYRQPVCSERCHSYTAAGSCHGGGGSSCVRRPTYTYGSSGGCQTYGRSVCSERCNEPSGSCHGGGSSCVRRPTYTYGSSGGCQSYGRSVCSERCNEPSGSCHGGGSSCVRRPTYTYGSSGGCQSYGRSVCSETCHGSGYQGGKPSYSKPRQYVQQCCPVQTCPPPVQQGCVPVAKRIPSQQQKQVCKVPAQKIK